MNLFLLNFIVFFYIKFLQSYEILPSSLLNRTQICQINCTRNQSLKDNFQKIPECIQNHFKICQAYLSIDFNNQLVSYSFTTADALENENSTVLRTDFVNDYLVYFQTDTKAIRFRQLKMKFSKINPHRLNINYYCRTQINDCAYQEIKTIYPVYIANQHILKRIQPIFYNESISFGTKIDCINDISNEKTILCSGYCTLILGLNTMTKSCNETLSSEALGINITLGLAYPNNPQLTAQVSSLILVCNKPKCNSNRSITEVIAIANAFLIAQSIGIRMIVFRWSLLLFCQLDVFLLINLNHDI